MSSEETRIWIHKACDALDIHRWRSTLELPDDCDIVLDYDMYGYYLASWSLRRIMWLEDVSASLVTEDIREALSDEHLGMRYMLIITSY